MNYENEKKKMFERVVKYELLLLQMNRDTPQWQNMRELIDSINLLMRSADSAIFKAEQSPANVEKRFRGIGSELRDNWNRR